MSAQAKAAPLRRTTPLSSTTVGAAGSKRASAVQTPSPAPAALSVPASPGGALAATQQQLSSSHSGSDRKENSSPVRMKAKLETLATRFDGFEDELSLARNKKKSDDEKRILVLQTQLNNLQSSLALESKNRSMSVKALQNWLTDRIAQWTEQIEAPMTTRLAALNEQVSYLVGRIDGLEAKQKEDREVFPRLVDGRCAELLREIADLKARFADAANSADEKQKRVLLKVQSESNKAAVQFAQDKIISDQKLAQLRAAIDEEVAIRTRAHELVRATIADEVTAIKADIAAEKGARAAADEDLVQAINHYSAALQDGIRVVSSQ